MKKTTKKPVKKPAVKAKARTEKEVIKGKTFYKIYKSDGSMIMLTDQEYEILKAEK